MADEQGQALIRGIDVDKMAKGYADQEFIFKQFLTNASTSARELRWYQKSTGTLTGTTTTGITSNTGITDQLAMPSVLARTWTRNTSYVKKFMFESETISMEDVSDSDISVLATTVRDITRAVASQIDTRIFNILTESQSPTNINSTTTTSVGGDQWDAASGQNPVEDVYDAIRQIAANNYSIDDLILLVSPKDYASLATFVFNQGAQAPSHGDAALSGTKLMTFAGCRVVVSPNVVADYAVVFVNQRAATWKSFKPITATTINEPGIGMKVRVWEEGEALLTDSKAVTLIIDTQT